MALENRWDTAATKASTPISFIETSGSKVVDSSQTQEQISQQLQTTNQSQQTYGSESARTTTMDPANLAALNELIAQLMKGGTPQMQEQLARIATEMSSARQIRSDYSKEAAFGDAQGAMAQTMRQSLEKMLPALTRSAEGAGTSANSMRALLLQDAATRSSEAASAIGLKASVDYGNISTNLTNILGQLASQSDPVTAQLMSALGIAKGAVTTSDKQSSGSSSTTGSQETSGSQITNTSGTQVTSPTTASRIYDPTLTVLPSMGTSDYSSKSSLSDTDYARSDALTRAALENLFNDNYSSPGWGEYNF